MGTTSPADGAEGPALNDGEGERNQDVQDQATIQTDDVPRTWELWILIFKGHPRDIQSTRVTDLYLEADGRSSTNCTFRLEGQPGGFHVLEEWNQPEPRLRSNFHQKFHVATLQPTVVSNSTLRGCVHEVPLRHNESDFNCQTWVGDVIEKLQTDGLISGGDAAVDAMVKSIYQAPWE